MYKIVGQTYIGKGHFEYHTSCELNGFFFKLAATCDSFVIGVIQSISKFYK